VAKHAARRPSLVIGFAAETQTVVENAKGKRKAKGVDWIVANDVSASEGVFGGDRNRVHLVTAEGVEDWPEMDKAEVAEALLRRASAHLAEKRESV
jgi:phosphopantothenoylcysteine decarboxylase/phosphopantothenate--cysteine ligase